MSLAIMMMMAPLGHLHQGRLESCANGRIDIEPQQKHLGSHRFYNMRKYKWLFVNDRERSS
jgi:hypothetical protein